MDEELRKQVASGLIAGGVAGCAGGPLHVAGLQSWTPVPVPMAPDSIFDIASVGKTFTSYLCAMLYAEGRLDPDASFTRYLPEHVLARESCDITVRDLAMHIGGFDNAKPYIDPDPSVYDQRLFEKRPIRRRGEAFEYACSNYVYLGRIVQNILEMDLEEAAFRFIWKPLGMTDTCWHDIPGHPRAVQNALNGAPPIGVKGDEAARVYPKAEGNGAAFSTASDLLKFADDLLHRRLLPPAAYDLLFTCAFEKGGARRSFGWDMCARRTPPDWSSATISHGGFVGHTLAIDPVNGIAAVALTNRRGDWEEGYAGRLRLLTLLQAAP